MPQLRFFILALFLLSSSLSQSCQTDPFEILANMDRPTGPYFLTQRGLKEEMRIEILEHFGRAYVERLALFARDPFPFDQLVSDIASHRRTWEALRYDRNDRSLTTTDIEIARAKIDDFTEQTLLRVGLSAVPRDTKFFLRLAIQQVTHRFISAGTRLRNRKVFSDALKKEFSKVLTLHFKEILQPLRTQMSNIERARIDFLKQERARIIAKGYSVYRLLRIPYMSGRTATTALPAADLIYEKDGKTVIEENKVAAFSRVPFLLFKKAIVQLDSTLYFYRQKFGADAEVQLVVKAHGLSSKTRMHPYSVHDGLLYKKGTLVLIQGLPVSVQ